MAGEASLVRALMLFLTVLMLQATFPWRSHYHRSFVREACKVTNYQTLCIRSLARYSKMAKKSPTKWAHAGVLAAHGNAKALNLYLRSLDRRDQIEGEKGVAISDCVDLVDDALEKLDSSVAVLTNFSRIDFKSQMTDLTTWIGTALAEKETCWEGLQDDGNIREDSAETIAKAQRSVSKAAQMTSNALALILRLRITET